MDSFLLSQLLSLDINIISFGITTGIAIAAHSLTRRISDPEKQELIGVVDRAFAATFKELLADVGDDDLRIHVKGLLSNFIKDQRIYEFLLKFAFEGNAPDMLQVKTWFEESGFDVKTLPIDLDVTTTLFVLNLSTQLQASASIPGNPLFNQVNIALLAQIIRTLNDIAKPDIRKVAKRTVGSFIYQTLTVPVERSQLFQELIEFVSLGNGIVVGQPGAGKSFALNQISLQLTGKDFICICISVTGIHSRADINARLGITEDFVSYLQNVNFASNALPGIILIDGYDAARSSETRAFFRALIEEMIQRLKPRWNIIVSVRTYDAKKSETLQDLFADRLSLPSSKFQMEEVHCRHFVIPQLDDDEVQLAVKNIGGLVSLYETGSPSFQRLMHIPFNLWLVEKLLFRKPYLPELSSVSSETELLALFWRQRIEDNTLAHSLETMIKIASSSMVEHKDLTVSKEILITQPQDDVILDELLSLEILTYKSHFQRHLEFTHNIFFDYAVAILILPENPKQFIAFFASDDYLPIFLLPSLEYFFASAWLHTPHLFWAMFWELFQPNIPLQLKLFARLIPPRIIATQSQDYAEIEPLVEGLTSKTTNAPIAVASTLRLILTKGVEKQRLWITLAEKLVPNVTREFVVDLAKLVTELIDRSTKETTDVVVIEGGIVGRKLVQWGLSERESISKSWIDSITARLFLPIVTKTFGTAPVESKELIQQLLTLAREKRIPVEYLNRLADDLDSIAIYDPEYVGNLYVDIFGSVELGDDSAFIGGIVVQLVMSSKTEREMVEHQFVWYYPQFLRRSALHATIAGLNCINQVIITESLLPHLRSDKTLEDAVKQLNFRGKQSTFIQDASYLMWQEPHDHEPLYIAVELFRFIEEQASENKLDQSNLDALLNIFRDHAKVAYLWSMLLEVASRYPSIFAWPLFELCVSEVFMLSDEVLQSLGSFLTSACPYFTPEQMVKLENTIVSLPYKETDSKMREHLEHRRNRLLARIPKNKLATQEGKDILRDLESKNAVPENSRLVSVSSYWGEYGETERLNELGVDVNDNANQQFRNAYQPLKTFAEQWSNENPSPEAVSAILPVVDDIFRTLIAGKTDVDKNLVNIAWTELAEAVERMCHVAHTDEKIFDLCKAVMLHCSKHLLPKPDLRHDAEYSIPSWTPAPRTAAARGLLSLAYYKNDNEILDGIHLLIIDPVPDVRFCVAHRLLLTYQLASDFFWIAIIEFLKVETNPVVIQAVYGNLMQEPILRTDQAQGLLNVALKKILIEDHDSEMAKYLLGILPWYIFVAKAEWATEIASIILLNPVEYAEPLSHLVFDALQFINATNIFSTEGQPIAQAAIQWIDNALTVARDGIQNLVISSPQDGDKNLRDKIQSLQKVIDATVNRIYFEGDIRDAIAGHSNRRKLSDDERSKFYVVVKGLLSKISSLVLNDKSGIMPAFTSHHFMEIMNGVLEYDPVDVFEMATNIARSSQGSGYQFDSLAVREVIKLVEHLLADFQSELRNPTVLLNLLTLLDIFSEAGWSEALELVGRLSEITR